MGVCGSVCGGKPAEMGTAQNYEIERMGFQNDSTMAPPVEMAQIDEKMQVDVITQAIDTLRGKYREVHSRVVKYILETRYPELMPDREEDWHLAERCEIKACHEKPFRLSAATMLGPGRHHCRMCARSVCGFHSKGRRDIKAWGCVGDNGHVRVCDACAAGLDAGGRMSDELQRYGAESNHFKQILATRSSKEWRQLVEQLGLEFTPVLGQDIIGLKRLAEVLKPQHAMHHASLCHAP